MRGWCGCLSGARCRLAYGPADATASHCLLLQLNPDWFYLSGTVHLGSPRQRAVKHVCVCSVFLKQHQPSLGGFLCTKMCSDSLIYLQNSAFCISKYCGSVHCNKCNICKKNYAHSCTIAHYSSLTYLHMYYTVNTAFTCQVHNPVVPCDKIFKDSLSTIFLPGI